MELLFHGLLKVCEKIQLNLQVVFFVFITAFLKEVEQQQESSRRDSDLATKRRILLRIQQTLIAAQEVGDEKLQIVQTIQDLIENKARQLELDYRNLGKRISFSVSERKWQDRTVEFKPVTSIPTPAPSPVVSQSSGKLMNLYKWWKKLVEVLSGREI
jgi:hypothetical protein